jgi:hypothetical protein
LLTGCPERVAVSPDATIKLTEVAPVVRKIASGIDPKPDPGAVEAAIDAILSQRVSSLGSYVVAVEELAGSAQTRYLRAS